MNHAKEKDALPKNKKEDEKYKDGKRGLHDIRLTPAVYIRH